MSITPLSRIFDLPLSVRATNCLMQENIIFIGDVIQHTASELRRFPGMDAATFAEIESALAPHGLAIGNPAANWPPVNIEEALAA